MAEGRGFSFFAPGFAAHTRFAEGVHMVPSAPRGFHMRSVLDARLDMLLLDAADDSRPRVCRQRLHLRLQRRQPPRPLAAVRGRRAQRP